ncbi:MAG TPA: hypothetical protein VGL77_10195 [Armatimonadota bacterium]|jgi:hypothetical protein
MNTVSPSLTPHAQTAPSRCRARHAARGQALIMAVLIMFLLVALAGLFIAMLNHAAILVARAEDRSKLEDIALAGLRVAQNELQQSANGADWRPDNTGPDTENPGWVSYGGGFYRVTVGYGPQGEITNAANQHFLDNPLDRFLRIDVDARYMLENPPGMDATDPEYDAYRRGFLSGKRYIMRKVTAYMPVGLTDQLLWITNLDGSPEPVVLGSTLTAADMNLSTFNQDPTPETDVTLDGWIHDATKAHIVTPDKPYLPLYEGPVRIDADVSLGNLAVYLTNDQFDGDIKRMDQFLVTGTTACISGLTTPLTKVLRVSGSSVDSVISAGIDLNAATAPDRALVQTLANNPLIRPLEVPRLDQRDRTTGNDRYRLLTRDSGVWDDTIKNADDTLGNYTGAVGLGEGLYINNLTHVQYNGDLKALRAEWLDPKTEDKTCWHDGIYDPFTGKKAVMLTLHDWGSNSTVGTLAPYIEVRSADPDTKFYDKLTKTWVSALNVPYPRNGVVFAEGNVIVKGNVPASLAYEKDIATDTYKPLMDGASQAVGGSGTDAKGNKFVKYYVNDYNRRFDLTVVSGGTIYIEGNLLGPATRGAVAAGSPGDSKLALLAMDNVCLNPTKLIEVHNPWETIDGGNERAWRVKHDTPLQLEFSLFGDLTKAGLVLRDAGEAHDPIESAFTGMQLSVNDNLHNWNDTVYLLDQSTYFFGTDQARVAFFPGAAPNQRATTMYPTDPFRAYFLGFLEQNADVSGNKISVQGKGSQNQLIFSLDTRSTADYLISAGSDTLGPGLALKGIDVQVDALIYAQRGSWFVIPGKYYDDEPTTNMQYPFPQYREPQDVRIVVQGSIVENRPAPPEDEEEYVKHWRGANSSYYAVTGTTPKLWDPADAGTGWDFAKKRWVNRRMGIEYHYDASLSRPVCYTVDAVSGMYNYLPRLPKLPVSPSMYAFGTLRGA